MKIKSIKPTHSIETFMGCTTNSYPSDKFYKRKMIMNDDDYSKTVPFNQKDLDKLIKNHIESLQSTLRQKFFMTQTDKSLKNFIKWMEEHQ